MEFQRIQGKIYRIFIRVNKKDFLTLIRKSFLLFIFLKKEVSLCKDETECYFFLC